MKFNKQAVQHELDMAAHELDKAGHKDLAEKVDLYGDRLMKATAGEVPLLRRALSRVLDEAKRRMGAAQQEEQPERAAKAQHAVERSRRASDSRKEVLKRRLMAIAAKRKHATRRIEALRDQREARTSRRERPSRNSR